MSQNSERRAPGADAVALGLETMKSRGADRAQARIVVSEKTEIEVDAGAISLLRTTADAKLTLTAIAENRRGSITVNRIDPDSVRDAAAQAVAYAMASSPDSAYDIAPQQEAERFNFGGREPDRDLMHRRMDAFLQWSARNHPRARLEQCGLDFMHARSLFQNTNGVSFESETGAYNFGVVFTTKDGKKTTCMNYAEAARRALDEPLERWGGAEELMRQSAEQLDAGSIQGKFVGDLIVTPHCLFDLVEYINAAFLSDPALIRGTSPLKDSLGKQVAAPILTLRSCPISPLIQAGYFFTPDGFRAEDSLLIDRGALAGFTLSLYGSRKTRKPKPPNAGGCWVIDPGSSPLAEMISSTNRGLLLCRFSGDDPSANGDFSGVAKNSYLIEGGKIARPVTETTIAGNLADLLLSISAISRERVDFGRALLPWVRAAGITISGK